MAVALQLVVLELAAECIVVRIGCPAVAMAASEAGRRSAEDALVQVVVAAAVAAVLETAVDTVARNNAFDTGRNLEALVGSASGFEPSMLGLVEVRSKKVVGRIAKTTAVIEIAVAF